MRRVVEKTGLTYEDAVVLALAELGLPVERAVVALISTRDTDARRPGPEEYTVRAWERDAVLDADTPERDPDVPPPHLVVCQKTAPSFTEAKAACLAALGISEDQADISILRMEDTNPLRPGPERVTVRVWRKASIQAPEENR
jgi:predicted RNA-binding protein Jag